MIEWILRIVRGFIRLGHVRIYGRRRHVRRRWSRSG